MHNRILLPRRVWMAAVIGLVAFASAARAQWTQIADLQSPRVGHMTAAVGTKAYVFSFFNGAQYSNTAASYDGATNGPWTDIANMPAPQLLGYAVSHNGKIYLTGGVSVAGQSLSFVGMLTEYDPVTNTYTTKAAPPKAMWYHTAAVLGNRIYMWGGLTRSNNENVGNTSVLMYDIASNTWSELAAPAPYAGINMAGASDAGALYSIGGSETNQQGSTSYKKAAYRATADGSGNLTWTAIANYPEFVDDASAGVLDGKLYVAGGMAIVNQSLVPISSVYTYNSGSNTWDAFYRLPAPIQGASGLVNAGTALYALGGDVAPNTAYKLSVGAPQPVAHIEPATIYIGVRAGQTGQTQFAVANYGVAPLTGTATASTSEAWLSMTGASNFNIAAGSAGTYTVTVNASSLSQGNYTSNIALTTNDPDHATINVPVKVYVRDNIVTQPTRVVLEESSGAWCGPCGVYGVPEMKRLTEKYGESLIAIALHNTGGYGASADTLATSETEQLGSLLKVTSFPTAAVSRRIFSGSTTPSLDLSKWDPAIQTILQTTPNSPIAIDIKSYRWDTQLNSVFAVLELSAAAPMVLNSGTSLQVTGVLIEDSILYQQNGQSNPFYHLHVARDFWPSVSGRAVTISSESMDDNVLMPGAKMRVNVNFKPEKFARANQSHMVFMVHLNNGSTLGPIIHATEIGLTDQIDSAVTGGQITFTTTTSSATVVENNSAQLQTAVENGTTSDASFELTRTTNNLPNGWESRFCWNNNCTTLPQQNGPIDATLAPGQTGNMVLNVMPNSPGTGTVTLRMTNTATEETHDETYTITATANPSGGVLDVVVGNAMMNVAANTPNPASDLTTFAITLMRPASVGIDVIALDGTTVLQIPGTLRDAGTYNQVLNVAGLPAGVYTVRFTAGGMGLSRTLNVVR